MLEELDLVVDMIKSFHGRAIDLSLAMHSSAAD
jgi:hypothetical protein